VFREPDNPLVDALVMKFRTDALLPITPPLFPKGSEGARAALTHLVRGGFLGIMMDQKMNNGIALTFFGLRAMTAPAMARLALRHRCPIIMGRAMREGPARYRFEALPPLPLPDSGDREADVAALTQAVNDRIEAWVRERPEEWLWQHRRFDKARYRGDAAEAAALAAAG
jgi:KDO2-lipid IV(A) lauroyltransferase